MLREEKAPDQRFRSIDWRGALKADTGMDGLVTKGTSQCGGRHRRTDPCHPRSFF